MKLQFKIFVGFLVLFGAGAFGISLFNSAPSKLRKTVYDGTQNSKTNNGIKIPSLDDISSIGEEGLKTKDAKLIVEFLDTMPNHGLNATDTSALKEAFSQSKRLNDEQKAKLKASLVQYARRLNGSEIDWKFLGKNWDMRPASRDFETEYENAIANQQIPEFLATLTPAHSAYLELVKLRAFYSNASKNGGFIDVKALLGAKVGLNSPSVVQLRQRLLQENYQTPNSLSPEIFDEGLKQTIEKYQKAHGIKATGEINEKTLAALNISAQTKLKRIDLNLERERWLPHSNPQTRVEANIPNQWLIYYENGARKLEMPTIVGKTSTKTPIFVSEIHGVVFNPAWYKPASIRGRVRVQKPGPFNSLGRVKFDLKNNHSVFLHDTPNHGLFSATNRTFSHGCVRLHYPKELAEIIAGPEGYTREKIDEITKTLSTKYVKLKTKTPVYILYRTAFVADSGDLIGVVQFFNDPYKWDELLEIALDPNKKAQVAKVANGDDAKPAAP